MTILYYSSRLFWFLPPLSVDVLAHDKVFVSQRDLAPMEPYLGLDGLSTEVILRILGHIDNARDLCRVRRLNQRFYRLGRDTLVRNEVLKIYHGAN